MFSGLSGPASGPLLPRQSPDKDRPALLQSGELIQPPHQLSVRHPQHLHMRRQHGDGHAASPSQAVQVRNSSGAKQPTYGGSCASAQVRLRLERRQDLRSAQSSLHPGAVAPHHGVSQIIRYGFGRNGPAQPLVHRKLPRWRNAVQPHRAARRAAHGHGAIPERPGSRPASNSARLSNSASAACSCLSRISIRSELYFPNCRISDLAGMKGVVVG